MVNQLAGPVNQRPRFDSQAVPNKFFITYYFQVKCDFGYLLIIN